MRFIWATRGRTWGFRFLRDGGYSDPLPAYEEAFAGAGGGEEVCHRAHGGVALRFPDPQGRTDAAGRTIPHDFVVFGAEAEGIDSVERGRQLIWPLVDDEFDRLWHLPRPFTAD